MASRAFTPGEFFQRYRANNGVRSEERTTPASNLSEESTNLERNMENSVCEDDKIVAVDVHPVAASISNPIEESRRIRGHQNAREAIDDNTAVYSARSKSAT